MTTKTTKTMIFAAILLTMIVSTITFAEASKPQGLEDATPEEIAEYNLVMPLLEEQLALDKQGREYSENKSTFTDADRKYLDSIYERIKEIRVTIGKISADQRELYAMDKATEAKFMISQQAFIDSGIEFSFVSVDTRTATLNIALPENQRDKADEIKKQIEQIIDVPYVLKFADFHDAACSTKESNCDPIVGGIEINDSCSISIPAVRNISGGTEAGFLTAGHCTSMNANVYQPNNTYLKDGITTKHSNGGSCDCAFVKKTGSEGLNSAVWWTPTSSQSITAKNDPLVNDYVYMIGKTSAIQYGKVISVTAAGGVPTISNMIRIDWFAAQPGDSGGAIISATSLNNYHGLVKGFGDGDTFASKWSKIDLALDLQ